MSNIQQARDAVWEALYTCVMDDNARRLLRHDPNERNALDAQAEDKPDWDARRRFMNRTFRATRNQLARHDEAKPKNVCERHGLHKVVYGDKWRCRK